MFTNVILASIRNKYPDKPDINLKIKDINMPLIKLLSFDQLKIRGLQYCSYF
jgi:hypothetical protein